MIYYDISLMFLKYSKPEELFKEKMVIKRILILSICIFWSSLIAEDNVSVKDDLNSTKMVQKDIVGCEESASSKKQKQDIELIKKQLNSILAKLSEMDKKVSGKRTTKSNSKKRRVKSVKKAKKRTRKAKKRKTYLVVKVRKGDRLSDYAKRFYGDKRKYYKIYRANQDKIGEDFGLTVGDRIIIPTSKNYKYKKFKKKRKIIKRAKVVKHKKVNRVKVAKKEPRATKEPTVIIEPEVVKEPTDSYATAKYISKDRTTEIQILDEVVYIDDEVKVENNGDFIPLDENKP
jgi:hypothetical protein